MLKEFDNCLLNLAWSLWTELGVAGTKRSHQHVLILIEELILFTSVLARTDPRLRDESLDWCSKFNRFISISRLKSILKNFGEDVEISFSWYASTLNLLAQTKWPVFREAQPLQVHLSQKSVLRPLESPALLNIRARGLFGTGARADIIAFFLTHENEAISILEITEEIGYSKRSLAELLDDLHSSNLFTRYSQGNQLRFQLNRNSPIFDLLKPVPQYVSWRLIFTVLLAIRNCIVQTKNDSASTKVVAIRNCLSGLEDDLNRLGLVPPSFYNDISSYLETFNDWIINWAKNLSEGKI
jgi:hypothetical protein